MAGNTRISGDMLKITDRETDDDVRDSEKALAQAEQKAVAAKEEVHKQQVLAAQNEINQHFDNDDLADTLDIQTRGGDTDSESDSDSD